MVMARKAEMREPQTARKYVPLDPYLVSCGEGQARIRENRGNLDILLPTAPVAAASRKLLASSQVLVRCAEYREGLIRRSLSNRLAIGSRSSAERLIRQNSL
jgi:hypothetical protein